VITTIEAADGDVDPADATTALADRRAGRPPCL
jgi:hypothetical protein